MSDECPDKSTGQNAAGPASFPVPRSLADLVGPFSRSATMHAMKVWILRMIAGGAAVLAVLHVGILIPALRSAWGRSDFPFHDTYVRDMFGFRWWALPAALLLVAVSSFLLSRRATAHAKPA